ncbi:hypothetical protein GCM10017750_68540 [Streptomyces racemochromogenes]
MTSLRLTSLGAALALTVLAGAGAAHAAVPASVPTASATGQTSAPLAAASPASAAVPDFSDGYGLSVLREETQVHSPTDFTLEVVPVWRTSGDLGVCPGRGVHDGEHGEQEAAEAAAAVHAGVQGGDRGAVPAG